MTEGFRVVDKRHPAPPVPPPARYTAQPYCWQVLPRPDDAPKDALCGATAGHDGLHAWQYCPAETGEYECPHECELAAGHDGPHRVTFEWD